MAGDVTIKLSDRMTTCFESLDDAKPAYKYEESGGKKLFTSQYDASSYEMCYACKRTGTMPDGRPMLECDPTKYGGHRSEFWKEHNIHWTDAKHDPVQPWEATDHQNVLVINSIDTRVNGSEHKTPPKDGNVAGATPNSSGKKLKNNGSGHKNIYFVVSAFKGKVDPNVAYSPILDSSTHFPQGKILHEIAEEARRNGNTVTRASRGVKDFMVDYKGDKTATHMMRFLPCGPETHKPAHFDRVGERLFNQCENLLGGGLTVFKDGLALFDVDDLRIPQSFREADWYRVALIVASQPSDPTKFKPTAEDRETLEKARVLIQFPITRDQIMKSGAHTFAHNAENEGSVFEAHGGTITGPTLLQIEVERKDRVDPLAWNLTRQYVEKQRESK